MKENLQKNQNDELRFKDFRGLKCPLNYVKTKVELAQMKKGERLKIWLDDGLPADNVPRSAERQGQKVISKTKVDDHWSVIIEKG